VIPPARREALPSGAVMLIWLAAALLALVANWSMLGPAHFGDGDDALRLQQVRDLLAGQGWYDLTQHRIAPPGGVPMHWTRVVDLPLALVIVLLRPLIGMAQAESAALALVPLLTLLCAMLLAARLAAHRLGRRAAIVAAVLVLAAFPASLRMMPLRIDHHGWQFVLALLALNGMAARSARAGGALAGLALALSLAISLEALPLAVIFAAVCALRLLRGEPQWITAFLGLLAVASLALFAATRGVVDLVDHCDALSPVHLAALCWSALGTALTLRGLRRWPPPVSVIALALVALGAVAILALRTPQCLGGDAFAALDPLVRKVWLGSVAEGLPVWRQDLAMAATITVLPLYGLFGCWRLWRAAPDASARAWWADMAVLLGGATVIGLLVARAAGVSCLFATVPSAWLLGDLLARWQGERLMPRRMARAVGIVALVVPGAFAGMAASALAPLLSPRPMPRVAAVSAVPPCDFAAVVPALARLPQTTVLSGLDIGPTILVTSRHAVVATAHHRASAAMRDAIVAFLGPDHGARAIMARRGAELVVVCPTGAEAMTYRRIAPDGFMAHLASGHAPDWLTPLPGVTHGGVRVWRVRGR